MSARLLLAAAIALGLSPLVQAEATTAMQQVAAANPLLKPSTLEYQFPPFDQIKDRDAKGALYVLMPMRV